MADSVEKMQVESEHCTSGRTRASDPTTTVLRSLARSNTELYRAHFMWTRNTREDDSGSRIDEDTSAVKIDPRYLN